MYKLIYLARRNPTVAREEWPGMWRSHAIFASQFPVLEAKIAWMRYCNRIDLPAGESAAFPGLSSAHDGVAIAAGEEMDGLTGGGFSPADRARIDADELCVFDMPTPEFTYYCTEAVLRDGPAGEAALFHFLARNPGMTRDRFDLRIGERHAGIAAEAIAPIAAVTRYVVNRPMHPPLPRFPFDGIVECWFATMEDAKRTLAEGALAPIAEDLGKFCDMDGGVALLTSVCHRWPKG